MYRKKIVAYWDSRACVRALEGIAENGSFGVDGKLTATMFWDEGQEKFADKVNGSSSSFGDRRSERAGGGGRNRDRSLSPRRDQQRDDRRRNDRGRDNNNRRDDNRYNNNNNNNRNDDRRRSDRDSGRNDYGYSSNTNVSSSHNQQQQPALNLMDILSQSKSVMQPPIINPGYGYAPPQQMSFPGQPVPPPQNAANNVSNEESSLKEKSR